MSSISESVELVRSPTAWQHPLAVRGGGNPQALWIACSERVLDVPLARIQQFEAVALCRQFGGCCGNQGPDAAALSATIARAVASPGLREIVVCGHSGCEALRCARASEDAPWPDRVPSLIERVRMREDSNLQARARLAEQVQWLRGIPAVAAAIAKGELQLRAVFYLVEVGLFVEVDPATGEWAGEPS